MDMKMWKTELDSGLEVSRANELGTLSNEIDNVPISFVPVPFDTWIPHIHFILRITGGKAVDMYENTVDNGDFVWISCDESCGVSKYTR